MNTVVERVVRNCRFPSESQSPELICALSGGADSLALVALAVNARGASNVKAIHVDHGLREGSEREAILIRRYTDEIGVQLDSVRVHVEQGPNLEARARAARYDALPADICTGHTADDVAETLLMNLLRGSGLDGLSPMLRSARPIRPLLGLHRADTEAVCASLGWIPLQDSMNSDPRFTRTRVRTELIPLMSAIAARDVSPVLARSAQLTAGDVAFLDELAAQLDATDAKALANAPSALARRALRQWIIRAGVDPEGHPPPLGDIERAMDVVRCKSIACEISFGWRLSRTQQRLRLDPPSERHRRSC